MLLAAACLSRGFVAETAGDYGWAQVDAHGPPADDDMTLRRLEFLPLGLNSPCDELQKRTSSTSDAPILIFVHGIGAGDAPEWDNAISLLMKARPAAAFMFKWVAYEDRDLMVQRLATGVSRLARCTNRHLIVLAHSAGGVLASYAASQLAIPEGTTVDVVTVASPLAGAMSRKPASTGEAQLFFLFDLGTRITGYPEVANTIQVWHLRTAYPSDEVMAPGSDGVSPNDKTIGVTGAIQLDLPSQLSHVAALTFVARRMARERWLEWLSAEAR